MPQGKICKLALEDGMIFTGLSFGATGTASGEVVFNTGLTGYQEILTDPSYTGQIVTMTYTEIGNYGVNLEDIEARDQNAQVSGFVIKDLAPVVSNFRASESLADYLASQNIIGIYDIDTRALTRHIRNSGALNGVISTEILDDAELVKRARDLESMSGKDLVQQVCPTETYDWQQGYESKFAQNHRNLGEKSFKVVALDCGIKTNILRNLREAGCDVKVVSPKTSAEEILAMQADGVFVSNGPGDPAAVEYTVQTLKNLVGKIPMFGICLGHQMLSLALGAKTYKMKFGHHGCNHPVRNEATGKVEVTSQNHGFAVDADSLKAIGAQITHVNLNDNSVSGFVHPEKLVFSVQYHPEASPGPHDATYLFDCFRSMMETGTAPNAESMQNAQQHLADEGRLDLAK